MITGGGDEYRIFAGPSNDLIAVGRPGTVNYSDILMNLTGDAPFERFCGL